MTFVYNSQLDAFDLYHIVQEVVDKDDSPQYAPALPALGHAVAGSVGSAISNVAVYPLALVVARLQIQRQLRHTTDAKSTDEYHSISDALQKIYRKGDGWRSLYVGLESDTGKTIADAFLFFLGYTFLRKSRLRSRAKSHGGRLSVFDELAVGFLAGAFAKLLTTPVANIVTRLQTRTMLSDGPKGQDESVGRLAKQIYRERGLKGFWAGYSASLVLTLNPTLTFFFFETLKRLVLSREKRSTPTARATLLLAAVSKALASSITYPFSLAKTRMQVTGNAIERRGSGIEKTKRRGSDNVFGTVARIAASEGLGNLYAGLRAEILKGVLSHGITMLCKDVVHKATVQLYFIIFGLLRRKPIARDLKRLGKQAALRKPM